MLDSPKHPEAKHIVGEVYEFEEDFIHMLDKFEDYNPRGCNNWYTRMQIDVRLEKGNKIVECGAYLISENIEILVRLEKNDHWFSDYTKGEAAKYDYNWTLDPECRLGPKSDNNWNQLLNF